MQKLCAYLVGRGTPNMVVMLLFNYTPLPWFVLTQVFWDVFVGVCDQGK